MSSRPTVLILTPVKNGANRLERYRELLDALSYPRELLSLGFLESDSDDGSHGALERLLPELGRGRRRIGLWKRDFGFRVPPGLPRWAASLQIRRRTVLARSRNHLLSRALDDEDWVLWLDVDLVDYPSDVLERLLDAGRDILHPHCLHQFDDRTFDLNAWRDQGRLHLGDLYGEGDLVHLDAVGSTMLLVRADLHRDGLVFPPFPYGASSPLVRRPGPWGTPGEIESEGLGMLARDMGHQPWGMPSLHIRHRGA